MNQIKNSLLAVILLTGVCLQVQAQKTDIRGTVLDEDGEPAISVVIRDMVEKGEVYGTTDYDGHFHIKADPATSLHFSGLTYMSKVVELKGKTNINVTLSFQSQKLDEIVVVAKRITNKMIPEQTDIEIVGNQYIIHPKIKIPQEMFKPNTRIVVQPVLENRTQDTRQLFRPAVVTGKQYSIMLERMMEFDLGKDPLYPYQKNTMRIGGNEVVTYTDSLYNARPNDVCRCDIYMYLVSYRKVLYKDTMEIARGTVNPMRFFDYKVKAAHITDERYMPRQEKQLRGDKGEVSLTFIVNKTEIDNSNPNNAVELAKMQQRLLEIQNSPDTEFQAFAITGVSSPEGRYEDNLRLAQKRTDAARIRIFGCLHPATVNAFRDSTSTEARVEPWETIAGFMREDSLSADGIENAIRRHPGDMNGQYREIRSLPDYLPVIHNYLSRSRKVEYSFTYSVMRLLRDDEIQRMYEEDYRKLTRYEFWRMYTIEKTDSLKEQICSRALEVYPGFMAAANELAAMRITRGKPDAELLERFVDDKAPEEVLNNHVAALLADRQFLRADSVAAMMPENPQTDDIRTIVRAFNGNYQEAYDRFASQGGINEVVLLLALKRNKEAFEKAQELPDDAKAYYLRAIGANRLDMVTEAVAFLKRAIILDPELMETARIDGDVTDLTEQLEEQSKDGKQEGEKEDEKKE